MEFYAPLLYSQMTNGLVNLNTVRAGGIVEFYTTLFYFQMTNGMVHLNTAGGSMPVQLNTTAALQEFIFQPIFLYYIYLTTDFSFITIDLKLYYFFPMKVYITISYFSVV